MKIQFDSNIIKSLLKDVYFLNGTAYSGKSTMVQLLAEKHDGICCGENFLMDLGEHADPEHQPNLCYFDTMSGWQEFIGRSPDDYDAWLTGVAREAVQLELIILLGLCGNGKKIFVDTNIPVDILREISDYRHVAVMLSPREMSVDRFFDRPDAEKQFLYQKIMEAPDPEKAMENYRNCLELANGEAHYREFAESGFFVHKRTADSTIEGTLRQLEEHFLLTESGD